MLRFVRNGVTFGTAVGSIVHAIGMTVRIVDGHDGISGLELGL
jgi:hypothetical protein